MLELTLPSGSRQARDREGQGECPSTGYDRDAERIRFPRGPRWRRALAVAVFLLSVIVGAVLASLATGVALETPRVLVPVRPLEHGLN